MAKTLFDKINKSYKVNVKCTNCGEFSEISVPKGITIDSFMTSERSLCPSCGCNTLTKYTFPKKESGHDSGQDKPKLLFDSRANRG